MVVTQSHEHYMPPRQSGKGKGASKGRARSGKKGSAPHEDALPPSPPAKGRRGGKGGKAGRKGDRAYRDLPYDRERAAECYVYGHCVAEPSDVLGVGVFERNGVLGTPAELLSLSAFDNGTCRSRNGQYTFQYFLPLSLTPRHHKLMKSKGDRFKQCVQDILDAIGRRSVVQKESFGVQAAQACGHLMAGIVQQAATARSADMVRRLVDAYFAVLLTLERIDVETDGAVSDFITERVVRPFLANPLRRRRDQIHNLGVLPALFPFHADTSPEEWERVAAVLLREAIARRVFDVVEGQPGELGAYPELAAPQGMKDDESLCAKMWVSEGVRAVRVLFAYQNCFVKATDGLSAEEIVKFCYTAPDTLHDIPLTLHRALPHATDWHAFYTLCHPHPTKLPSGTNPKKNDPKTFFASELRAAILASEAAMYHGGYRHDAYKIFLEDAVKRSKVLRWEGIGVPDEVTGVVNAENKMYDYVPE